MFRRRGLMTPTVESPSDAVDETVGAGGSGKDTMIATIDVPGLPRNADLSRI